MRFLSRTVSSLAILLLNASIAPAQTWTTWTGPQPCISTGTVQGTLFGSTSVEVMGDRLGFQLSNGTTCGSYPTTSQFAGYTAFTQNGLVAPPDYGEIFYEAPVSSVQIQFGAAVENPYLAIGSMGFIGGFVTWDFGSSSFSVVSHNTLGSGGTARHGYGTFEEVGNALIGQEFSGIIQFHGVFTSLEFSVTNSEQWNEFTVGAERLAAITAPEPSSALLIAIGLSVLMAAHLTRRNGAQKHNT